MLTRLLDYVYYRIDDYYRRNTKWQGGALGGYSAAIVMAGAFSIWAFNGMFIIWFKIMKMPRPMPPVYKPILLALYLLFCVVLVWRYVPKRRELRTCYISEQRDVRWKRKGYLIAFGVLFSFLFLFVYALLFGEVVHVPQPK
jgi:hypothetical protein